MELRLRLINVVILTLTFMAIGFMFTSIIEHDSAKVRQGIEQTVYKRIR